MDPAPAGADPARAAFTLLEVLAVVALVAILSGLLLGGVARAVETARSVRARAELAALAGALDSYKRVYGDFPHTDDPREMLRALLGQRGPRGNTAIAGRPLLDTARLTITPSGVLDPWEQPYVYAYKAPASGWTNPTYVLSSAGPDRQQFSRLTSGGFVDRSAPENLDNIHAGQN